MLEVREGDGVLDLVSCSREVALVFSESLRDAEIGLIRSCQDTARSVTVIREM